MAGRDCRITVMAEDAFVRKSASGLRMARIESRVHAPVATFLCVPAERKFDQDAAVVSMKIGPCVITRAENVIDSQFLDIGFLAVEPNLPPALKMLSAAPDHRV